MGKTTGTKLNLGFITKQTTKLATDLISGKEIAKRVVTVDLELPEALLAIYSHVSEVHNIPLEDILSRAASEGINKSLEELQNQAVMEAAPVAETKTEKKKDQANIGELAKSMGLDLSGVQSQMDKLGELANQLQGLERMLGGDNAAGNAPLTGDITKTLEHLKEHLQIDGKGSGKNNGKPRIP